MVFHICLFNLQNTTKREFVHFQYSPPYNKSLHGIPITLDQQLVKKLGFPPKTYTQLNSSTLENIIFVTASNAYFFSSILATLASIQRYRPDDAIVLYDLGLTVTQRNQLMETCNVIYRKFDFDQYPEHVRDLHTYAFKPLIIWVGTCAKFQRY